MNKGHEFNASRGFFPEDIFQSAAFSSAGDEISYFNTGSGAGNGTGRRMGHGSGSYHGTLMFGTLFFTGKALVVGSLLLMGSLVLSMTPAQARDDDSLYDLGEIKVVGRDRSRTMGDDRKATYDASSYIDRQKRLSEEKVSFIEESIAEKEHEELDLNPNSAFVSCFDVAYGSRGSSLVHLKDNFETQRESRYDVFFDGKRTATDGWREHDAASRLDLSLDVDVTTDYRTQFRFGGDVSNGKTYMTGPAGSITRTARRDDRVMQGEFGFTREYSKFSDLSFDLRYRDHDRRTIIPERLLRADHNASSLDIKTEYNLILTGKNLLSMGYRLFVDDLGRSETDSRGGLRVTEPDFSNHNFFVQRDIDLSNSAQLVLRGDYDIHSENGNFFSPKAKIKYRNYEKTELSIEGGKGVDIESYDQLLFSGDYVHLDPNQAFGTPNYSFVTFAAKHIFDEVLTGSLTLSRKNYNDYHYMEEDRGTIERLHLSYANGEVDVTSLDMNAEYKFSRKFTGKFLYSRKSADLPGNGGQAPYIPKNLFDMDLTYETGDGITFNLNETFRGNRYADAANTRELDSYVLLNAKVQLNQHENIEPYLEVRNLFDKDYEVRKGYSGEPRTFMGGIKVRF
ncbi:MAG: hypothetical protein CVV64_18050 [Candidatus Wallbacteria bacterium HGW-Wallbacteria-1]|jgi:hypothetical protein|uniref:TonB-dependent receptor-like beta-barrel domain-containing protein n=1 Tax=Candidatus Wallbacteria bacterium HGW-Wallbacteria-1 TaxID=2013854 RepID=A0A2N1PJS7_9BACT|nr:MAG: hypothetical protein CVV64_18050 [Candidatus Wallbacteria bacterium HGW-Wallbacteria-1]